MHTDTAGVQGSGWCGTWGCPSRVCDAGRGDACPVPWYFPDHDGNFLVTWRRLSSRDRLDCAAPVGLEGTAHSVCSPIR